MCWGGGGGGGLTKGKKCVFKEMSMYVYMYFGSVVNN